MIFSSPMIWRICGTRWLLVVVFSQRTGLLVSMSFASSLSVRVPLTTAL